eukprot:1148700-Pelagomonas_calceolata.AAC.5
MQLQGKFKQMDIPLSIECDHLGVQQSDLLDAVDLTIHQDIVTHCIQGKRVQLQQRFACISCIYLIQFVAQTIPHVCTHAPTSLAQNPDLCMKANQECSFELLTNGDLPSYACSTKRNSIDSNMLRTALPKMKVKASKVAEKVEKPCSTIG